MDILIPYISTDETALELRYTLRGIEQFFPERGNIFIIGACPGFLQNVIHIPCGDSRASEYKQFNIYHKLSLACVDKRVSDEFVWFSDDHFLLSPYVPDYRAKCTLRESILAMTAHQTYRHTLLNTFDVLGYGRDYGHGPMVFRKDLFVKATSLANWRLPWGYAIKSLYCGLNGIQEEPFYPDLKIKEPLKTSKILDLLEGRPYFSTDARALNASMCMVFQSLYPNKSQYEK